MKRGLRLVPLRPRVRFVPSGSQAVRKDDSRGAGRRGRRGDRGKRALHWKVSVRSTSSRALRSWLTAAHGSKRPRARWRRRWLPQW